MAEWIKWALVSARTKWAVIEQDSWHTHVHTCKPTYTNTYRHKTALLSHECTEHIISPLPSHPSLNGNFVFLCGTFWDCCHQHTCYTPLEYPGFTPRGNAASSEPSTLTLYILTFLESTAKRYFPSTQLGKHLTKRAPHPYSQLQQGLLTLCGVKMTALLRLSPRALAQLSGSPYSSSAYFTAGLTVCTHRWASAACSGHCGADPPSCAPSEYWGSRSLFLSSTALIFEFILIKIN